ncbi:MAG: ABC transporter ATP-binding protein [Acidobacteria bacterium 13_1_20CM_3_53_8]|nr:MAG: ABC transporter ATP-binding protein [Acidobacteria bacterium 13_1_20CM_3_53_8]
MQIEVHNRCSDFNSYRAARVKSLFNAESGCNFDLSAQLDVDDKEWRIGIVVGPSGSGKSSMGQKFFGSESFYQPHDWPTDEPIIDAILPDGDFNEVTAALAAVGLGSVPSWLRPYHILSNGEKFRADLARIICEKPEQIVVDEFTSVVDRQIARFGALAFAKAWRRTKGQVVLLSCHYDIVEWVEPDWVFDTATGRFARGRLWRRPSFDLEIRQTDWSWWSMFEPHHYLKLPKMIAATNYVGTVEGEPVAHVAFSTRPGLIEARACRLVVMPEWQGAGVGLRFLNELCAMWLRGENRYRKPMPSLFHTSHPGLCAALRRDARWVQVSANLYGGSKARSRASISKSARAKGKETAMSGYGGHFRAVQGFRFLGARAK